MSTAMFEAVLGNLAVAAGLAGIAFLVGRRRHRPAVAHALWLLVLLKLLTPPIFAIPIPCLPAATAEPALTATKPMTPESVAEIPTEARSSTQAADSSALPMASASPAVPENTTSVASLASSAEPAWRPSLREIIAFVWVGGIGLALLRAVRQVRRFARFLRYAAPAPRALMDEVNTAAERLGMSYGPRVRVVAGKLSPFVWSIGRPTLFLPHDLMERLTPEQRQAILVHEMTHLRRWDHVVRLVETAALAAYWWCPLAWLARRELHRLEEEACDADVLAAMPGSGYDYASAILATIDYLAGAPRTPAFAAAIGEVASLKQRLLIILKMTPAAPLSPRSRRLLMVAGLACLITAPKMTRLAAETMNFQGSSPAGSMAADYAMTTGEDRGESLHFVAQATAGPKFDAPVAAAALCGSRIAVATGSEVAIWDLRTRQPVLKLSGHSDLIAAIAFSLDGSRIATGSNDGAAIIWDANDGRQIHTFDGQGRWMKSVAFSPDGRMLVTGGYNKTVRLWDVATGSQIAAWTGHSGGIRAVTFSPNGRTVASAGAENEVRLWDVSGGACIRIWRHDGAVNTVAFSPDGTLVASGGDDRTVRLWNAVTGRDAAAAIPLPDSVTILSFTRRGVGLIAGSNRGHLVHIDPHDGQVHGYLGREPGQSVEQPPHAAGIVSIENRSDNRSLFTVARDGSTLSWTNRPLEVAATVFTSGHATGALALSPDGTTVATGGKDGVIRLWDAKSARLMKQLPGHAGGVRALVFGSHGRLISAGADERVRIWNPSSDQLVHTFIQSTTDLRLAMSPDGNALAIGGGKAAGIGLVNLSAGGKPRRIAQGFGEVTALSFTPRGDRIAAGYADGVVRLLEASTGEELVRGRVAGPVTAIAFDPAASIAAIVVNAPPCIKDEEEIPPRFAVEFLDVRDGSPMNNYRSLPHPGPIAAVAFAADGRVLTAANDGNLYLWDAQAGHAVRTIHGHADAVRDLAIAPDRTAAYSAGDRSAKKWPLVGK